MVEGCGDDLGLATPGVFPAFKNTIAKPDWIHTFPSSTLPFKDFSASSVIDFVPPLNHCTPRYKLPINNISEVTGDHTADKQNSFMHSLSVLALPWSPGPHSETLGRTGLVRETRCCSPAGVGRGDEGEDCAVLSSLGPIPPILTALLYGGGLTLCKCPDDGMRIRK